MTRHVDRVPSKGVEREADGRFAIPLWLRRDGHFDGDVALRLTPAEAELLHAQLCFALDGHPVTRGGVPGLPAPDCRKATLGSAGVRWP
ncbi:hypothetical protein [Streptomyces sp. HNM0574]|uniref:hypothetical protein n=1 Tax=Streptomyces sp. HNM0574 TaxID=2714954 RepID=UPI0019D201A3|nr:hypothetical protein [Streptomyces sp. HNM0574]